MSITISGAIVMAVFLLVALLILGAVLATTTTQGTSLREASDERLTQLAAGLSITSTSAADSGDGTNVTVTGDNTGAISYGNFTEMDVLTRYTNTTGDQEVRRLLYVCRQLCGDSGSPGDNEWTISSISPDSYNPKMWDSDEMSTIVLRVAPPVKSGTSGTVVVVGQGGVSDTAYFNN